MAYPSAITQFTTKIDKNAIGQDVGPEYFNVPAVPPYELYLDHVPKDSATTAIGASGGATWTEVLVAPTSAGKYLVDYAYGKVTFHSGNAGAAAQATYKSLGDDVMAEHINSIQTEATTIETVLGVAPQGSYASVTARLNAADVSIAASGISGTRLIDDTVRAGALKSDIKGASWESTKDVLTDISAHKNNATAAHAASAISATAPGTTAAATVQAHINLTGGAAQTPTNPHGMTLSELAQGGDIYTPGNITAGAVLRGGNLVTGYISASGTMIPTASGYGDIGSQRTPFASGIFSVIKANVGYIDTLNVSPSTINIGGVAITSADGCINIGSLKIENRTNDTGCTQTGRIWIRTDI